MAERLPRAQPDSVANHVKARQSLIKRAVTWLATESGWARGKRSAICSGMLSECFTIFEQCSPCRLKPPRKVIRLYRKIRNTYVGAFKWLMTAKFVMALRLVTFRNVGLSEGLMFYRCTFLCLILVIIHSAAEALFSRSSVWPSVTIWSDSCSISSFSDLFNRSEILTTEKKQKWTVWNLMIINVWLSVMLYTTFQFQLQFIVTVSLCYIAARVKSVTKIWIFNDR